MNELKDCPDCGAKPGQPHKNGCDIERCSECGNQVIGCSCPNHDKAFARWTGFWPGVIEAEGLGIDMDEFYRLNMHLIFFVKPEIEN